MTSWERSKVRGHGWEARVLHLGVDIISLKVQSVVCVSEIVKFMGHQDKHLEPVSFIRGARVWNVFSLDLSWRIVGYFSVVTN